MAFGDYPTVLAAGLYSWVCCVGHFFLTVPLLCPQSCFQSMGGIWTLITAFDYGDGCSYDPVGEAGDFFFSCEFVQQIGFAYALTVIFLVVLPNI